MGPSANRTDLGIKLRAIAYYRRVGNKALTAKMFGVSDKTIRNWIKGECRLLAEGPSKIRRSHEEAVSLLERSMLHYVNDQHRRGIKIKYSKLVEHAVELKKAHKVRGLPVSLEWVTDFVARQRLRSKCEKLQPSTPKSTPKATVVTKVKAKAKAHGSKAQSAVKKAATKCLKKALKRPQESAPKKAGLGKGNKTATPLKKKPKAAKEKFKKRPSVQGAKATKCSTLTKSNLKKVVALSHKILSKVKTKKEDKQKLITHTSKKTFKPTPKKCTKAKAPLKPKSLTKPKAAVSAAKQSLKRARLLACKGSNAAGRVAQAIRTQKLRSAKHRRQPTKIFRTRYRIKEMQRQIEENRTSDFFDFFYGLGLIPVSKDPSDSWCYPLIDSSQQSPCSVVSSDALPAASLEVPQSPTSPRTRRYLAWRPRNSLVAPPQKDLNLVQWDPGEFVKQEPGPSSSEDNSPSRVCLLQQTKSFFESIHHGSLQSENAVSPGESPITPEQLAVVKQLFPDTGQLRPSTFEKNPAKLSPAKSDASRPCLNLRPRSTEQRQRLADCFATPRKRKLDTPAKATNGPDLLYCTPSKAVDWLAFPDCTEPQKSMLQLESRTLMKRLCDAMNDVDDKLLQPKAKKEHFEEGVNLPHDLQRICHRRSCGKPDVPQDFQGLSRR